MSRERLTGWALSRWREVAVADIYTSSGSSSELDGTVYFTSTGAGVYKTNPGHATFFFPQYLTTAIDGSGIASAPGISFDSTTATHTRQVLVTTDVTGTVFTVQPYLDPERRDDRLQLHGHHHDQPGE